MSKKTVFTNITEYGFKKDKSNWKEQLISNPKKIVLQFDKNGNFMETSKTQRLEFFDRNGNPVEDPIQYTGR